MVFQIVIKNNAMKNIKDIRTKDQELLNNPWYNTSLSNSQENQNENKIDYI